MRPDVEKFAMPDPRERKGDRIDVAGVPVRGRRNTRVATSAVLVNAGDDPMIAILEADIDGVDMRGRGQRAVQQIIALLGAEIAGIRGSHLGEKAQRGFSAVDQVLGALDAGPAGLRDRIVQDRHHASRVLVVVVDQDENENGNAEADEQQRHDQTQPWPPHPGGQRKRSQPGQRPLQGTAASVREPAPQSPILTGTSNSGISQRPSISSSLFHISPAGSVSSASSPSLR